MYSFFTVLFKFHLCWLIQGKSSDELVTQDSDDDPDDDDDDDDAEDDEKQLPDPENIDSDSDDGGELVKVGGDADDADKAVTAVPSADVNPSEDVGGSDKNVKDVEKPKGDESRLKGDDFFDGLSQLEIDDDQVVLAGLEAVGKIHVSLLLIVFKKTRFLFGCSLVSSMFCNCFNAFFIF